MDSVVKGGNDLRGKLPFSDGVAAELDQVISTSNDSAGTSPKLKSSMNGKESVAQKPNDLEGLEEPAIPNTMV